jgi:protein STE50
MLRHIKDIRSPIAVAQQKQADRQQSSPPPYSQSAKRPEGNPSTNGGPLASPSPSTYSRNTRLHQTPSAALQPISAKAQVATANAAANTPPPVTGPNANLPWPENSTTQAADDVGSRSRTVTEDGMSQAPGPGGHADAIILSRGISYAIAIYPYIAELEDEFDVVV